MQLAVERLLRRLRRVGQVAQQRAPMPREAFEVEHLRARPRRARRAAGSCRIRSVRRSRHSGAAPASVRARPRRAGDTSGTRRRVAPRASRSRSARARARRCACRRASSTRAAPSRAAGRRTPPRRCARCCARRSPRRRCFAANAESCACSVPTSARSASSSTGQFTAPGNVIEREFGRAAHVDAVRMGGQRVDADLRRVPARRPLIACAAAVAARARRWRAGVGCASAVGWMRSRWK